MTERGPKPLPKEVNISGGLTGWQKVVEKVPAVPNVIGPGGVPESYITENGMSIPVKHPSIRTRNDGTGTEDK